MERMLSALTPQKHVKHLEVPRMNVLVFPLASLYISVLSANTPLEAPVLGYDTKMATACIPSAKNKHIAGCSIGKTRTRF